MRAVLGRTVARDGALYFASAGVAHGKAVFGARSEWRGAGGGKLRPYG